MRASVGFAGLHFRRFAHRRGIGAGGAALSDGTDA
jgi:hypothetical protein